MDTNKPTENQDGTTPLDRIKARFQTIIAPPAELGTRPDDTEEGVFYPKAVRGEYIGDDRILVTPAAELKVFSDITLTGIAAPSANSIDAILTEFARRQQDGCLTLGARFELYSSTPLNSPMYGIRDKVKCPDWCDNGPDCWYGDEQLYGAGLEHESTADMIRFGDMEAATTIRLFTTYADYRNDPEAAIMMNVSLDNTMRGRGFSFDATAGDMRTLAAFLTKAADRLESVGGEA
ncbi:hypothetical protein [Brevibacterium moorei]|uniref:hypothetical protein n=1 Tax=Brevibacterium moorei TaxID=2968457 RepID=UPI00211BB2FB|nr:hypothetical protein [Brevibacterium sp. 68QC2CO]MCQ9386801.1 hypothetical protein [Brevibacterium sp. 68QC2CO]